MKPSVCLLTLAVLLSTPACEKDDEPKRPDLQAPAKAEGDGAKAAGEAAAPGRVFFVEPADGATVPEQFEVVFGLEGKTLRASGATERDVKFGHHHLLIDLDPMEDMKIIPKDETHLHYGDGADRATVKLSPGKHRLTMQLADGAHRSYGPDWAATITVEVKADDAAGAADAGAEPADGAGEAAEAGAGAPAGEPG